MMELVRRCKPHSIIAAAVLTMREEMRLAKKHEAQADPERVAAKIAVCRALALALHAVPMDAADGLLKAILVLRFLQPQCPEHERERVETWIAELGAIGARIPSAAIRVPDEINRGRRRR